MTTDKDPRNPYEDDSEIVVIDDTPEDAFAAGDPVYTDEQIEHAASAIEAARAIKDPRDRFFASAGVLKGMYGDDLVVPD